MTLSKEDQPDVTTCPWRAWPARDPQHCEEPTAPTAVERPALATQLAVACLGAGVITTFAVAQGQNPLTALGITLFSAVAAVMVGQVI